jgi:hypothetical protein
LDSSESNDEEKQTAALNPACPFNLAWVNHAMLLHTFSSIVPMLTNDDGG